MIRTTLSSITFPLSITLRNMFRMVLSVNEPNESIQQIFKNEKRNLKRSNAVGERDDSVNLSDAKMSKPKKMKVVDEIGKVDLSGFSGLIDEYLK